MEQLNKIEIAGVVGKCSVIETEKARFLKMSVVTQAVYTASDMSNVIESTWITVSVAEKEPMPDFALISEGTRVHIWGRLRHTSYTTSDGTVCIRHEVIANRLEIIEDDLLPAKSL